MLKDKEIRLSLAKKSEPTTTQYSPREPEIDVVTNVTFAVKDVMNEALKMVAIYVAMDTGRKLLLSVLIK